MGVINILSKPFSIQFTNNVSLMIIFTFTSRKPRYDQQCTFINCSPMSKQLNLRLLGALPQTPERLRKLRPPLGLRPKPRWGLRPQPRWGSAPNPVGGSAPRPHFDASVHLYSQGHNYPLKSRECEIVRVWARINSLRKIMRVCLSQRVFSAGGEIF